MAGLLYKDFVGIKGKRVLWILFLSTFLFLVLRFVFPGTDMSVVPGIMGQNEAGEYVPITAGDLHDSLLVLAPMLLMTCAVFLPSAWIGVILKNDEKTKIRQYIRTLPLQKNAYIASKYLFIGISVYIILSVETVWTIIFNSCVGENNSAQLMQSLSVFMLVFCGLSLVIAAIELPFYITIGMKRGNLIKTGILEAIGFLTVAYLFFGNIGIFENFDIYLILNWCKSHYVIMTLISILTPVICLFLYWISYRITCSINQNREVEIYE